MFNKILNFFSFKKSKKVIKKRKKGNRNKSSKKKYVINKPYKNIRIQDYNRINNKLIKKVLRKKKNKL